ncbi:Protein kinase [Dimargaris xerosporica]|nr:Protein kinase [Dimargaris xerosporica]
MSKPRIGNYTIIKTLGTGSFGKVKLGVHAQTGHQVALKFISRSQIDKADMVGRVKREIQYLQVLRHPHIIKLYEVIVTDTDYIMVMEYAGAELFQYVVDHGRIQEDSARRFFQQILSAVDYCHRHKIVHRDLKPENVLLDKFDNVKIADFGLSNFMSDGEFLKTSCGSPNYAAPEVINGHFYSGPEVDVWSCGVILYVLLCGKLPFDDESIPKLFKKISSGVFSMPGYLSPEAQELLRRMLVVKPLDRITIPEIRNHPWFLKGLPEYLQPLAREDVDTTAGINMDYVAQLVRKLSYGQQEILTALREPQYNPATNHIKVAYQLVADQNRIARDLRRTTAGTTCSQVQNYAFGSSPPAWNAMPVAGGRVRAPSASMRQDTARSWGEDPLASTGRATGTRGRSQTTTANTPYRGRAGSVAEDGAMVGAFGRRVSIDGGIPEHEEDDDDYHEPSSIGVLSSSLPHQHLIAQQIRPTHTHDGMQSTRAERPSSITAPRSTGSVRQRSSPLREPHHLELPADGLKPPPISIPTRAHDPGLGTTDALGSSLDSDRFASLVSATPLIGGPKPQLPTSYQAYCQDQGRPLAEISLKAPVSVPIPQTASPRPYTRSDGAAAVGAGQPKPSRRPPRWHFGIRSRNPPREIMDEIFKTLQSLGIQWKPFDAWHVRCRYIYPDQAQQQQKPMATPAAHHPPGRGEHGSGYRPGLVVKFDMQLYKIDSQNYLVDFKYVPPTYASQAIDSLNSTKGASMAAAKPDAPWMQLDPTAFQPLTDSNSGQVPPPQLAADRPSQLADGPIVHSIFPFFDVCARLITKLAA